MGCWQLIRGPDQPGDRLFRRGTFHICLKPVATCHTATLPEAGIATVPTSPPPRPALRPRYTAY
ncbi:hypothetical protein E2C01_095530 [Portunus trituberculatus]|uniref:Uncharacterized protein n=1 Tax=Portunus trituberculatus TaxID=210409 RepID=A0A5B7JT90_PORTR|nr:hypothetical protein [Portunus trituberculatus]